MCVCVCMCLSSGRSFLKTVTQWTCALSLCMLHGDHHHYHDASLSSSSSAGSSSISTTVIMKSSHDADTLMRAADVDSEVMLCMYSMLCHV